MKTPDIMTEDVQTIRAGETVATALELLAGAEARHLPVVNERDELVGILSDRDLRGLLGRYDEDAERFAEVWNHARMPVEEVMTRDPITVDDEADVEDIVGIFVDERVGALPVVDSDKKVIGIVSYIDVLRGWQREHEVVEAPPLVPTTAELIDRARRGRGEWDESVAEVGEDAIEGAGPPAVELSGAATKRAKKASPSRPGTRKTVAKKPPAKKAAGGKRR